MPERHCLEAALLLICPVFYQKRVAMSTGDSGPLLQNEVLTIKEVATYLRVSSVTVWRWCQKGVIPASRVGRNWRIRREDVLRLFEAPEPVDSGANDQPTEQPEASD
jgi:excisionase family DNA binding protein